MKATVLTPTIGTEHLARAVRSVQEQTIPVRHVIVADGEKHLADVVRVVSGSWNGKNPRPVVTWIPDNTGADLWNGHKIYAHYAPLLDADYVFLLDEDNAYTPNHVETMLERAERYGFAWSYRNIICGDVRGKDIRESIGVAGQHPAVNYRLVDTSCWCFGREKIRHLRHILRQWDGDRKLTEMVAHFEDDFHNACTGMHTMDYYAPEANIDFFRSIVQ